MRRFKSILVFPVDAVIIPEETDEDRANPRASPDLSRVHRALAAAYKKWLRSKYGLNWETTFVIPDVDQPVGRPVEPVAVPEDLRAALSDSWGRKDRTLFERTCHLTALQRQHYLNTGLMWTGISLTDEKAKWGLFPIGRSEIYRILWITPYGIYIESQMDHGAVIKVEEWGAPKSIHEVLQVLPDLTDKIRRTWAHTYDFDIPCQQGGAYWNKNGHPNLEKALAHMTLTNSDLGGTESGGYFLV